MMAFVACELCLWLLVFRFGGGDGVVAPEMLSTPIVNGVTTDEADSIAREEMVEDVDENRGERKCGSMDHADETAADCQGPEAPDDARGRREPDADAEETAKDTVVDASDPANNPITVAGAKELTEKSSTDAERPNENDVVIAKESAIDTVADSTKSTEGPDTKAEVETDTNAETPTDKPEVDAEEPMNESTRITGEKKAKEEPDMDTEEMTEVTSVDANEPGIERDRDADSNETTEESDVDAGEATGGTDSSAKETILEQDAIDDLMVPTEGREEDAEVPAEESFVEAEGPADSRMDMEEPSNGPGPDETEPPKDAASKPDDGTDGEGSAVEPDAEEEPPNGTAMDAMEPAERGTSDPNDEVGRLRSMLDEGFARLRGMVEESDGEPTREAVESLCGDVWVVASQMLSFESHDNDWADSERVMVPEVDATLPGITLEEMSRLDPGPLKSLALESQQCLAGAGLAFQTDEMDIARLEVSTKIFDRLVSSALLFSAIR